MSGVQVSSTYYVATTIGRREGREGEGEREVVRTSASEIETSEKKEGEKESLEPLERDSTH